MTEIELCVLPLSELESMLKKCFMQRPDVHGKNLQADELAQYIAWMIRSFSDKPEYQIHENTTTRFEGQQLAELSTRIRNDPHDKSAIHQMSSVYGEQNEEKFILSDYDISVERMMRYMPSHWHTNTYFEVYYAFSGECPIYFTNEIITLRKGTVLIVAPGVVHASPCYHDDQVLMYYMIRSSTFDRVFWDRLPPENLMSGFFRSALSSDHPNAYIHFETGDDTEIRHLLFMIWQEFENKEEFISQMMNALMTEFFIRLLRHYSGTARLPRTESFFWKHEFSAILNYIQTNYSAVKLPELAEMFHYSERQITRIVQRCTGLSYSELINRLRMERASKLLRLTAMSMDSIADEIGYSNVSSFYRSFVKYHKCTPAEFRNAVHS